MAGHRAVGIDCRSQRARARLAVALAALLLAACATVPLPEAPPSSVPSAPPSTPLPSTPSATPPAAPATAPTLPAPPPPASPEPTLPPPPAATGDTRRPAPPSVAIAPSAVPPTRPDRIDGSSLRQTLWIDPASGLRTVPGCGHGEPRDTARWPTLLQPWLDGWLPADQRIPDWQPGCAPTGGTPAATLRIVGLSEGSRLRPAPQHHHVSLQLAVRGAQGPVYWLLDGQRVVPDAGGKLLLNEAGAHRLTVMDEGGRHHSVRFTVDAPPGI